MIFSLDPINIALSVMGVLTLALGFLSFLNPTQTRETRFFFYFDLTAFSWIATMFFFRGVAETESSFIWARLLYLSAASILIFFLYFSFIFKDEEYYFGRFLKIFVPIPYFIIAFISLVPGLLIKDIIIPGTGEKIIIFSQPLHILYAVYINGYFLWVYINFIRKFFVRYPDKRVRVIKKSVRIR